MCPQKLLPKKFQYNRLEEIFEHGFRYWKYFSFRMEFTLIDYVNNHIPHTYQTFKRPLLITVNAWISIIYLTVLTIFPDCSLLISLKHIEQMIKFEGSNLMTMDILIGCAFVEWMWFHMFNDVLHYHCSLIDFLIKSNDNNISGQLRSENRRYLINLYAITNSLANYFYFIVIMGMIYVIPLTLMVIAYVSCMLGQIFLSINFLLLLIEYFRIRMKQLYESSLIISNIQRSIRFGQFLWQRFCNVYVKLYYETSRLNNTIRIALFSLEMISKSSIMIACVFYSRQTQMNIMNMTVILALISAFGYTTCLYSRVSIIPSYNQHCIKLLHKSIARTQWLNRSRSKTSLMNESIINRQNCSQNHRHSMRRNHFIQTMSVNQFGFHCGQIINVIMKINLARFGQRFHLYKQICMQKIFDQGFEHWKRYSFRWEFSLDDYRNHKISYTYHTFKRSIWMSVYAWSAILYLSIMVFYPNNSIMIRRLDFEQMMNTERMDIFSIQLILNGYGIKILRSLLQYRLPFMDFLLKKSIIDQEKQFKPKNLQYLYHMYIVTDVIVTISYIIIKIELLIVIIIYAYFNYGLYQSFHINIIQSFIICIEQLYERFTDQRRSFDQQIRQNDWNQFQYEYVDLYTEIAQLNRTARVVLLCLEVISKTSIVSACIFYSRQSFYSIFTIFILLSLVSIFCLTNGLYSRIAHLPSGNQRCAKFILQNMARTQCSMVVDTKTSIHHSYRYLIKSSLFVQTMTNNRFGFTCGQVFFITKFRYIQIFIMNFVLILKFYKKISKWEKN
ncbi:hypothetical protein DERF_012310 [Dermatophagoides farinae]|uniref:Uncharacterized protein n=1 Tax=Dermatophagoides farinae TaxID=6954 RepID=A0A922HPC3_DERFA|nr:hypothetical protein DERF_012310 [Dermatophagoides farinae]